MINSFFDFKVFLTPEMDLSVKGANEKHLLIVIRTDDFTDRSQMFLAKVMGAAKFDLDRDVAIVSLGEGEGMNFVHLRKQHHFKHCIIFGLKPQELGLNFNIDLYRPKNYLSCDFLFAHSLEKLQTTEIAYKGALWKCLQALFL